MDCAIGTAIAIIIAKVPQEVPVEKAIKQLTKNTIKGTKEGESQALETSATYRPVPSSLQTAPIAKAININKASGIIPEIPFKVKSTISFKSKMPCIL